MSASDDEYASDFSDLGKALKAGDDNCLKALNSNWDAIMAATIIEMVQWAFEAFYYLFVPFFLNLSLILLPAQWSLMYVKEGYLEHTDTGVGITAAWGALGDISMARTNSKCVANIYKDLADKLKPDYKFASDTDFYLNSMGAA